MRWESRRGKSLLLAQVSQSTHGILRKLLLVLDCETWASCTVGITASLGCETWVKVENIPILHLPGQKKPMWLPVFLAQMRVLAQVSQSTHGILRKLLLVLDWETWARERYRSTVATLRILNQPKFR